MHSLPVSGVILAGGQATRMGGVDKGLQPFAGRKLVECVIDRLAPQVDELLINANRNADTYARYGYPVIADELPGFVGPLAGLHAALCCARHPLVVTAPCDSPLLPDDLVVRLHAALSASGAALAVATTGAGMHPVFCLCHRDLLTSLTAFLASGERRFGRWIASTHSVSVPFSDERAFANINTPEDLEKY